MQSKTFKNWKNFQDAGFGKYNNNYSSGSNKIKVNVIWALKATFGAASLKNKVISSDGIAYASYSVSSFFSSMKLLLTSQLSIKIFFYYISASKLAF